ncbi:class I SAM-dependent methyltransferase [Streptomyces sp. TRM68416]|uniref:class I SAM-dependent methyltransferase n=1 Tax=Streptomyces sp. TRM68416 TaxID=2758412 RepID=UPI001662087B|nr:methyltransferase domain-containing protein [Streptomyces sp. TRM68416]MBD0840509.1 methyltransferase domain-containing protein [Streptomyces sp. TRM68416]
MSGGWRGGDYASAGDAWAHAARDVVGAAVAELGGTTPPATLRALDVGTGSGPGALAAARAGIPVVGLDLEPGLLGIAAQRARTSGLAHRADFVAGDALALPFPRGVFDLVLSTFGVMFAPDAARAAAELVRVCRARAVVAVASWTPDGVMGRIAPTVLAHLDDRPKSLPPTQWGDPDRVGAWFAPLPVTVRMQVCHVRVVYPGVEHAVRVFENKPGPLRAHRAALEAAGRWDRARAALAGLFEENNRAQDGTLVLEVPYLLVLGRVAAAD